ncbi:MULTISPECIES: hypothetical protein [Bacillus cereus group]|nr:MULTISPECIES: hypothetical protein [Bacillus cereus group]
MEFQIKTKAGEEVFLKMSTPVALTLISTIATGIGTVFFRTFM